MVSNEVETTPATAGVINENALGQKGVISNSEIVSSSSISDANGTHSVALPIDITIASMPKPRFDRSVFAKGTTGKDIARGYLSDLVKYINENEGVFLKEDSGRFSVLIKGKRIEINDDKNNLPLSKLVTHVCQDSLASGNVKNAILQFRDIASDRAGDMRVCQFSALSEDKKRLYIPITIKGEPNHILAIDAHGTRVLANGEKSEKVWVLPAKPSKPGLPDWYCGFNYSPPQDAKSGLQLLEEHIVSRYTCAVPEMRWFCAMQSIFFPYLREMVPVRMALAHTGNAGSGKTSSLLLAGNLLHRMDEDSIPGDVSESWLKATGDPGLLALDNKEEINLRQIEDFLIQIVTGGMKGRATATGETRESFTSRPVLVFTSIEGASYKPELERRIVEVKFQLGQETKAKTDLRDLLLAVSSHRNAILSSLPRVFERFFGTIQEMKSRFPIPMKMAEFPSNYRALCTLLHAYGHIAEKGTGWADEIIEKWVETIDAAEADVENPLEFYLLKLFREIKANNECSPTASKYGCHDVEHNGRKGMLFLIAAGEMLSEMARDISQLGETHPFGTAKGGAKSFKSVGHRLRVFDKGPNIFLIDRKSPPPHLAQYSVNTSTRKPHMFFVPNDVW